MQPLPVGQHVLNMAVVLGPHKLRDLVLGQPLEIRQVLRIGGQVGLTGHDARLHEKGLLALNLSSGRLVDTGLGDVVSCRVVADHPGVHVDAGRLAEGAFGSLDRDSN